VKDVREELRQYEGRDIASVFKERAEKQIIKQKAISKMFGGTMHHDKNLPTASELLQTAKGDAMTTNAPGSTIPAPVVPETQQSHEGKFWAWLKRKNDQSMLEEQRLQEEWHRMQQQQQLQQQQQQQQGK
jgi:hypothetical protein